MWVADMSVTSIDLQKTHCLVAIPKNISDFARAGQELATEVGWLVYGFLHTINTSNPQIH